MAKCKVSGVCEYCDNKKLFGTILLITIAVLPVLTHGSTTTVVKHTSTTSPEKDGFWTRSTHWKARWVKYWRPMTIYESVWKKVWGPVVQNEWVPLPKAPPGGWTKKASARVGSHPTSESY